MPPTKEELGYLAGIVDAEGFIARLKLHTRARPYWAVGISNTSPVLIRWVKRIGGGVGVTPRKGAWKTKYDWWCRARADVFVFLHTLEPYLMIKRSRAKRALSDLMPFLANQLGTKHTVAAVMGRLDELLNKERLA